MKNTVLLCFICVLLSYITHGATVEKVWHYVPTHEFNDLIISPDNHYIYENFNSILIENNNGNFLIDTINSLSEIMSIDNDNIGFYIEDNKLINFDFKTKTKTDYSLDFIEYKPNLQALNRDLVAVTAGQSIGFIIYSVRAKSAIMEISLKTHYASSKLTASPGRELFLSTYDNDFLMYDAIQNKILYKTFFDTDTFLIKKANFVHDSAIVFTSTNKTLIVNSITGIVINIFDSVLNVQTINNSANKCLAVYDGKDYFLDILTGKLEPTGIEKLYGSPYFLSNGKLYSYLTIANSINMYDYSNLTMTEIYSQSVVFDTNKYVFFPYFISEKHQKGFCNNEPPFITNIYDAVPDNNYKQFSSITYTCDDFFYACDGTEETIYKIDLQTYNIIDSMPPLCDGNKQCEVLNDKYIIYRNGIELQVFDVKSREYINSFYDQDYANLCFDKNNSDILYLHNYQTTNSIISLPDGKELFYDYSQNIQDICCQYDKSTIYYWKKDESNKIFSYDVNSALSEKYTFDYKIKSLFLSKHNKLIAIIDSSNILHIYNTKDFKPQLEKLTLNLFNNHYISPNFEYVFSRTYYKTEEEKRYASSILYNIHYDETDNVNEQSSNNLSFSIHPNPATDKIEISTSGSELINSLVITDINGKEVYHVNNLLSQKSLININNFVAGIYFIKVNNSFNSFIKK